MKLTAKIKPIKRPQISKKTALLFFAAVLIVVMAGVAYFVDRKVAKDSSANQSQQLEPVVLSEEEENELRSQLAELIETFTILEELGLSDAEKSELYTSAAFVAAQLREPNAKEYAKLAISFLPPEFLDDANHHAFVQSLRDIEAGNYESYINSIQLEE